MKKIALLFVPLFGLSACTATPAGSVQIDGSSTVYPITEAVAEEFYAAAPNLAVTVGLSGTGGGFKKLCRGEVDINNASRPIKESEKENCEAMNLQVESFMVAYDGIAVVANPANTWVDHLTMEELKKIWEPAAQGKLTRWNQIRPEWPDSPLNLYGPGTASGTFDYFTEAVMGEAGQSRGDYTASEDDNVLVQGLVNDKGGLGFFGLAYFEANREALRLVPMDSGSGPLAPSAETVKNGSYSPLSRPLYIYVTHQALQKGAVLSFVDFYLQTVNALAQEAGYVQLSAADSTAEFQRFKALTAQLYSASGS